MEVQQEAEGQLIQLVNYTPSHSVDLLLLTDPPCLMNKFRPNAECEKSPNLFEVVEGGQDDVMAASHQANRRQQLQHQGFGPEKHSDIYLIDVRGLVTWRVR